MEKKHLKEALKHPVYIWYYIQGKTLWFLIGKYIIRYFKRMTACNDCFNEGYCKHCGCDFNSMALTNKPCQRWDKKT